MKHIFAFVLCAFLAACADKPQAFTPLAVDMPVVAACPAPQIAKPPDALAALKADAPVDQVMRVCLQQALSDRAYQAQLEAAQAVCR